MLYICYNADKQAKDKIFVDAAAIKEAGLFIEKIDMMVR